jgi:hypothetical protein
MLVERFGVWMVVLIACWSQKHESLGITVVQSNVLLLLSMYYHGNVGKGGVYVQRC